MTEQAQVSYPPRDRPGRAARLRDDVVATCVHCGYGDRLSYILGCYGEDGYAYAPEAGDLQCSMIDGHLLIAHVDENWSDANYEAETAAALADEQRALRGRP